MSDIPESHLEFARELVALARKHSMNHLHVEFDHMGSKNWETQPPYDIRSTKTFFDWEEGRHGAKTSVTMHREELVRFEEVSPAPTPNREAS